LLAQVNRTTLIMALETHFTRMQIFGDELAFATSCQKKWPDDRLNRVVAKRLVASRVGMCLGVQFCTPIDSGRSVRPCTSCTKASSTCDCSICATALISSWENCRPITAAHRFQRREAGHKVVAEAVLGGLHHLYRDAK
jgi:hypothetical protein